MYQNKRILAVVPARAGSKGVPGKNRRHLAGRPLVEWTFQAAKACKLLDEIICTTDDTEVMQLARQAGIGCMKRPAVLAQDTTPMLDVLLHLVTQLKKEQIEFDYMVLLQPTSPLRTAADITRAVCRAIEQKAANLATVTKVPLRPGLLLTGPLGKESFQVTALAKKWADVRRQDAAGLYVVNGAIYVYKRTFLRPQAKLNAPDVGLLLAKTHSLDIDTEQDFKRCQRVLLRRHLRYS